MSELASDPREQLRALVAREPGLHLREIPRRIDLSLAAVRYHLDVLAAEGVVFGERAGGFVRYFPPSAFSRAERAALASARVAGQRLVLEALVAGGPASFAEMGGRTRLSKGSLHWHVRKLCAAGVTVWGATGHLSLGDRPRVEMVLALTRPSAAAMIVDAAFEIFDPPR